MPTIFISLQVVTWPTIYYWPHCLLIIILLHFWAYNYAISSIFLLTCACYLYICLFISYLLAYKLV